MIDWKIQVRAQGCQACSQKFVDKQAYYTLLFDRRHNLERLDVCPACWESQYGQGANDRKGFISFWQGVFSAPVTAAPDPIQKESAESLLRKLLEAGDHQYAAACFILAVMLERKRLLKVKAQSTHDQQRTLVYEHAKTGEVFTIEDPNLRLDQLTDVQHMVAHLLEHGLNPIDASPKPEASASPATEPASIAAGGPEPSAAEALPAEAPAVELVSPPPDGGPEPPNGPTEPPGALVAENLAENEVCVPPV